MEKNQVFGEVLFQQQVEEFDFNALERELTRPHIKPRYRISVLNPDETISYVIPNTDILKDGISYTEEYQNGQRKNITLKLFNGDGKYTPSINGIWLDTKFGFDIGLELKDKTVWFPKGVYVMGDVSLEYSNQDKSITIQLKDKYSMFEGKMGTLDEPYEIPEGSDIIDIVQGILNFGTGSGYIFDYKQAIFDPSFIGKKTQATIRVEDGGNIGEIISSIATQLSAEYYYNNVGNLCFYPINDTIDDASKPIIWTFDKLKKSLHNISLSYKNEEVINVVKVVGDNIDQGVFSAVVQNNNPISPICVERIGKRVAPKYTEPNVWSNETATDLARYYLRKASFVAIDFNTSVSFNPFLSVNNICEVENSFLKLEREKLLITSISFGSGDGLMSLKMCNTKDLPFM